MNFTNEYLQDTIKIINSIDTKQIEKMHDLLMRIKYNRGRLFIIGVGGGAGNASHAVCDFRRIGIETYTPTDNVSSFSATINDNGWND